MKGVVLQINTVAVNGSTGRISEGIGEAAITRGYESYIAYGRGKPLKSSSTLIKIGDNLSVITHILRTRLFDKQGLCSYLSTKNLIKEIDKIHPTIVHLHNLHGNYLNYKVLFKYLAASDIPVVWTIHDCWPITGHCVHFSAVDCDKWKHGCEKCPRSTGYPKSIFLDRSKQNYIDKKEAFTSLNKMFVVPVSKWLEDVLKESFLGGYDISYIHNGIDVDKFFPRKDEISRTKIAYGLNNKFVILGVATGWSKDNGLYDFLELRKHLSDEYSIVLVGVTPSLKKNLPDGIIGIERTDSVDELAAIYSCADIFINGSKEETFGLVTAEAMACGTPVIVYDSTACAEIVADDTGYVVEVGDFNAIITVIKKHRDLPEETKNNMSERCSNYVRTRFRKEDKYNEYVDLYDRIVAYK